MAWDPCGFFFKHTIWAPIPGTNKRANRIYVLPASGLNGENILEML
jgi:hypothetical protein